MSNHAIDKLECSGRVYHADHDGPVIPKRPKHATHCPFCGSADQKRDFFKTWQSWGAAFVCSACGAGYEIRQSPRVAHVATIAAQAEAEHVIPTPPTSNGESL